MLEEGLEFNYLNLEKYLYKLYKQGIDNINILLLISLEKDYYEGDNFKRILKDLINLSNNLICCFDDKEIKFKVNKISLDAGDTANRWRWIYRYNEKYMLEHNLTNEEDIPQNVVDEISLKSYETAKQQGKDWFMEHALDAINLILPENKKINKELQFNDRITTVFEGNNQIPTIDRICYDYWLNHPNYKKIEKAILELRKLENSVVEKSYDHDVNYFIERMAKRGEFAKFPKMFEKYSRLYVFDETMPMAMRHQEAENNFEFYWFGREPSYIEVYQGKKARNNEKIKYYLENELKGVDTRNYIPIREKKNN